ncbi:endonuclease/exonuclease/phosphatase family protein [Phanerochaete sordida]|uniref:Endonuclease/exonuclease/phosphatase family protein n=1 Tax=Phanerochaete sordida TaxID=48140 RepID=A0A9P3GG39_9APHY|nr:endonuclease/exonuclease/phosphatase family protein [Phanerochaete sordida]
MPVHKLSIRIATYSLRYDSKPDNITVEQTLESLSDPMTAPKYMRKSGEQPWSTRRIKIWQTLVGEGVVLFGIQEGLTRQVHDLATLLGDDWDWVGVGRDDGKEAGEYNAIFYNKKIIDLREWDTFWLSSTPFELSRSNGSRKNRICTVARLAIKTQTGTIPFSLLNTHLDHKSDDARQLGASLVLQRARFEAFHAQGAPVVVIGDFNSPPAGKHAAAYEIATGTRAPVHLNATFAHRLAVPEGTLEDFKLQDMRGETPRAKVVGNFATSFPFDDPDNTSKWSRIDFIFGGSNGEWKSTLYKVGTSLTDDGVFASDHHPVFVDVTLRDK